MMLLVLTMMCTLPAVTSVEDLAVRLAFVLLRVAVDMFHRANKRNAEGTVGAVFKKANVKEECY